MPRGSADPDMRLDEIVTHGAPTQLVEALRAEIPDLTEIQGKAVEAGLFSARVNLLVAAPTSSGKTLIAEMALISPALRDKKRRSLFLVPYRALADEHYETLIRRYDSQAAVVISTGDWSEFDQEVRRMDFNVCVMTYEKLAGLLIQEPEYLEAIDTIAVDEVQMVADPQRGPGLEVLLTRILQSPSRLICLSASLGALDGFDSWLRATVITATERPIPLTEGAIAFTGDAILLEGGELHRRELVPVCPSKEALITSLARHYVDNKQQIVIFRNTVRESLTTLGRVTAGLVAVGLDDTTAGDLATLDETDVVAALRQSMASGAALHNADMTTAERRVVERAFAHGRVQVLVSTPTLSMGVNLPCDVVLIADQHRPVPRPNGSWGRVALTVTEYRNAAGRAGRLGKRLGGMSLLVADEVGERDVLIRDYVQAESEQLQSKIPARDFNDLVFTLLCSRVATDSVSLSGFIQSTFAYPTFYERSGGPQLLQQSVDEAVSACLGSGLVLLQDGRLVPTQLALALAGQSLGFVAAIRLTGLLDLLGKGSLERKEIIHALAECREETQNHPFVRDDPRATRAPDAAGCRADSRLARVLAQGDLSEADAHALVKTDCVLRWMEGGRPRDLAGRHSGISLARVQSLGRSIAWLLDALASGARARALSPGLVKDLRILADEARYGLPASLSALAALRVPTVSREQMMALYDRGQDGRLFDLDVLLAVEPEQVSGLLTAQQLAHVKDAIVLDVRSTLKRRLIGYSARAERVRLPQAIVRDLCTAEGTLLDQAVADALTHIGIPAKRIESQWRGEADIHVSINGTVAIGVTASGAEERNVSWTKVREVLGASPGVSPVNLVCIARPNFHRLAIESALALMREGKQRNLLLITMDVLADAVLRVAEGSLTGEKLGTVLRDSQGIFDSDQLEALTDSKRVDPTLRV